jgi:uncharacterized protein (DUF2235 family)
VPKKIVFCADGTWNQPKSPAIVSGQDTNVYKLYKSLAVTTTQTTTYDDGVGTDSLPVEHWLGGAFGEGLFQKIKDGYTAIAQNYAPGDAIYIFGFSRGAYTARSLAGMISLCGLPTRNNVQLPVDTAFQAYRHKDQRQALLASLASYQLFDAKIAMLGVWDTVGALGIPGALFGDSDFNYGFLDTTLHPDVQTAYHAVSIDERRRQFVPTLWTSAPSSGQTMEQVWFAGVHSDVGGGYAETGLSDVTLGWMLNKAIRNGIESLPDATAKYGTVDPGNSLGQIHESWSFFPWGFYQRRTVPPDAVLASSVGIRLAGHVGYRPPNLNYDPADQLAGVYSSTPVV